MRDFARKQENHAVFMQITAFAAVLFATIIAAHTPNKIATGHDTFGKAMQSATLHVCKLETSDTRVDVIDQVRSEAMLRARQAYGDEKVP